MHRYHRFRRTRTPKQSRTIPMPGHIDYGDGEDADKYYRCWNCGFVCDSTRDELGGPEEGDAVSYEVYNTSYSTDNQDSDEDITQVHYGAEVQGVSDENLPLVTKLTFRSQHVILKNDLAGDPKAVRVNYTPSSGSGGCPFCHTKNWRGDY